MASPMETDDDNNSQSGGSQHGGSQHSGIKRRISMTEDEQRERRASIREIMQDGTLSAMEKRRSIQSLMDGRRRSSGGASATDVNAMSMMAAAAAAAADFYDSEDDDSEDRNNRDVDDDDRVSVASSISSGGDNGARSRSASPRPTPRGSLQSYPRQGRSTSLKAFATGAQAVAAAAAAAAMFSDDPVDILNTTKRMEMSRPECTHYKRNCTIISPCCGLAFGCRICHDDCPVLPPPSAKPPVWETEAASRKKTRFDKRRSLPTDLEEEVTLHKIERFAIAEVICRKCYTRQSSKTNNCINCNIQFGEYHCNICNLWMSLSENPYHCLDCGFCRVGGRANFTHCHDCGMCIDAMLVEDHNCKAGKYMSNCPVCQEDLFSSRSASHEMPCGHAIHWHCFRELTTYDTRCPVCKKTAETYDQMAPTWSAMAMGIALQPVPPEMARVVHIICNDCEVQDLNRRWHFLGVQCLKCSSFNTTVEKTVLMGKEAADFLDGDRRSQNGSQLNGVDIRFLSNGVTRHHDGSQDHSSVGTATMEDSTANFSIDSRPLNQGRLVSSVRAEADSAMNDCDMAD